MIAGVRVRGHKSFYAYDLEEIKKISAKSGATKACQNQSWKKKMCPFMSSSTNEFIT